MGVQNFDLNLLIAIFFGLLAFYVLVRILFVPVKILLQLTGSAFVGGIMLYILNLLGSMWGVEIGINIVTAFIVGLLGIPGIAMLLVLQHITV